ncbi:hypothetical protein [Candidatus Entotheonella palauensis]|uniref:Uncharacterized protein n=1 Tax=Candidatus Entotheonella gemina TaxID=1429439 RepID=W4LY12_9BACT|nr:hypothetical protein [Candidatus Entotheonella palauensis]ETX02984.1 MAG: hypothetical protein ETSY2_34375 [Candidatus Entotheonella gemina]
MAISTFEGIVENGQIRLPENIKLPENAKVYVVIPDFEIVSPAYVSSPRLVNPAQVADFHKEIIEVSTDDEL